MERLNFSWVLPNQPVGAAGPTTDEDLFFLKEKGVSVLVRLAEKHKAKVTAEQVVKAGLKDIHEPVADFCAPSQEQIDRIVEFVKDSLSSGKIVAVSCGQGIGRTGTILLCILISLCYTINDAIETVERNRGKAWEVEEQHQAILTYARRIGKRG